MGAYDPSVVDSHNTYIGLREKPEDVVVRAQEVHKSEYDLAQFIMLKITFSAHGVAYYMTTCTGADEYYKPILERQWYYKDKSRDWGAYHFYSSLPLGETCADDGELLISMEWISM